MANPRMAGICGLVPSRIRVVDPSSLYRELPPERGFLRETPNRFTPEDPIFNMVGTEFGARGSSLGWVWALYVIQRMVDGNR